MKNQNDNRQKEGDFDEVVDELLHSAGWLYPQTPEQVERLEEDLTRNPEPLPQDLQDPDDVFERMTQASRGSQELRDSSRAALLSDWRADLQRRLPDITGIDAGILV